MNVSHATRCVAFCGFSVASPVSALSVSETFSFGVDTEWPLSRRGTECPQTGDCEASLRHCRNGLNALSLGERTTLWRPAMHAQLTGQIFLTTSERATPQIETRGEEWERRKRSLETNLESNISARSAANPTQPPCRFTVISFFSSNQSMLPTKHNMFDVKYLHFSFHINGTTYFHHSLLL